MIHRASKKFWQYYATLPDEVQRLATANYELLKKDPRHPSLHFKKIGDFWSIRIGIHYRAIAIEENTNIVWFWIGHHSEYDQLLARR